MLYICPGNTQKVTCVEESLSQSTRCAR